jgi:uncharacterized glyoxalase superfamily protein PhnB
MLTPKKTRATVIPCLRYRDAPGAIDWLCRAFGFEKHLVVKGEHGALQHAELSFGNGMIMVEPEKTGAPETQAPYLIVSDAEAVYLRAKAAGAKIVTELSDGDYGGRGFSCRDPEGRLWNVGTYDPWAVPGGT